MSIFTGMKFLLESPSGVFGLLTLIAITVVTWHMPSVGGVAFAAFVAVVPAILTFCEHREALASMTSVVAPAPPAVTIQSSDLPTKGSL